MPNGSPKALMQARSVTRVILVERNNIHSPMRRARIESLTYTLIFCLLEEVSHQAAADGFFLN